VGKKKEGAERAVSTAKGFFVVSYRRKKLTRHRGRLATKKFLAGIPPPRGRKLL